VSMHTAASMQHKQQVSRAASMCYSSRLLDEQPAVVRHTCRGVVFSCSLLCGAVLTLTNTGAGAAAEAAGTAADSASHSSGIPAAYNTTSSSKIAIDSRRRSTDCASTSYPTSYGDGWDALGACMTTAMEMEACVDAVVRPCSKPSS
jgi:hypothetical protein